MATGTIRSSGYRGRVAYVAAGASVDIKMPGNICLVTVVNAYYGNYDVLVVCRHTSGLSLRIDNISSNTTRWSYSAVDSSTLRVTANGAYEGLVSVTVIGD